MLRIAYSLAARQGQPGSYHGLFSVPQADYTRGVRLFTGEPVRSRVGVAFVLGQESCRALQLLPLPDVTTAAALTRAKTSVRDMLVRGGRPGYYCCARCSAVLWRNLATWNCEFSRQALRDGIELIRKKRDGTGKWKTFPFYYTLLVLSEIDSPDARAELEYAAPRCARLLRRKVAHDHFATRRRVLLQRVLKQIHNA